MLIEIKNLNQQQIQLNQNVTELELKKAEMMAKIHHIDNHSSSNESENSEISDERLAGDEFLIWEPKGIK